MIECYPGIQIDALRPPIFMFALETELKSVNIEIFKKVSSHKMGK